MVTRALAIVLASSVALAACQGERTGDRTTSGSGTGSGTATGSEAPRVDAGGGFGDRDADVAALPEDAGPKPDEPDVPDPGKVIAELGAIPAWQAVIERAQLLARRGERGVVYGRLGPPILVPGPPPPPTEAGVPLVDAGMVPSPYVWLIDDTEGNGSLGIRVKLGALAAKAKEGDRVAIGGAWTLDEERHWYWSAEALEAVPAATPGEFNDPPPPAPTHAIPNGNLPAGVRMISLARDNDLVYFQLVGPAPVNDGDGWPIADQLGNPVVALLVLPGERSSYGAQDMRAPDERWQLKRGQTYWVRIGKIRKRAPDKPAVINARTAPVRVN
jgi:hypothetical protein